MGRIRLLLPAAICALLVPLTGAQLRVQTFVTGLSQPVAMIQHPDDPSVQFVLQQRGRVRIIQNGVLLATDFLDLTGIVSTSGFERGLLGMAFHPHYASNGYVYFNYTDVPSPGNTRVVRYTRDPSNPLRLLPTSAYPILTIAQPFDNHNGGTLRFGPDGYLYIGMGDGGSANDPGNRAQTITNMLLGKMLRIDPDADDFPADPNRNYAIPPSNPFVGITGDDEIWAFGLRNPWKFSFDDPSKLGTGGMLTADVGQNAWEEVNYEPPLAAGRNYGWRVYEGNQLTGLGGGVGPFTFPIHVYDHSVGISITGGYVYRGLLLGDYFGRYFFADWGSGRVWSFQLVINPANGEGSASNLIEHTADLNAGAARYSSIDVDAQGELYLVDHQNGRILKIMPENRAWANSMSAQFFGALIGQLRGLSERDGKFVRTFHQINFDFDEQNVSSVIVNMQTDMPSPTFFDVFVDARHGEPFNTGTLRVQLRNQKNGRWDTVGTFPLTTTLTTHAAIGVPAAPYRDAQGRFDVRLFAFNNNALQSDPYVVSYDKLKVVPR